MHLNKLFTEKSGGTFKTAFLAELRMKETRELHRKNSSLIQVNFSHSALIDGRSKAWMAASRVQMRSPSASRWLQIAAGRHAAGREGWGCHCTTWPRGTPWISDPELRWSTISSFSNWNNKSQPFDSTRFRPTPTSSSRLPPTHPHPPPCCETNTRLGFHPGLRVRASLGPHTIHWLPVRCPPKVQNWSEVQGSVCGCSDQAVSFHLQTNEFIQDVFCIY